MASILWRDQRSIDGALISRAQRKVTRSRQSTPRRRQEEVNSANYAVLITDIKIPIPTALRCCAMRAGFSGNLGHSDSAVEDYEAAVQAVKGGGLRLHHKGAGVLEELKVSALPMATPPAKWSLMLKCQNFALKRDAQPQLSRTSLAAVCESKS